MRRSHFSVWAPHCPVCARNGLGTPTLGLAEGAEEAAGDVLSGILVCANPSCRHEYPVVDGIPIITPELRRHLGERAVELLLRDDLDPAVLSLIGDALGPDSWLEVVRTGMSTYAWDAFGDLHAADPAEELQPGAARRCLRTLLGLAGDPDLGAAQRMLDLGCGGGRTSFDLAAASPGALVLGVDSNLALLRLARRVATTGAGAYGRRRIGTAYDHCRFEASLFGRDRVDFWACDALALPFAAPSADLVLMLNLLDCVAEPHRLLRAAAAALRPNGLLLLATPFDWASRATPPENWIGGHSQRGEGGGAAEPLLSALLTEGAHPHAVGGLRVLNRGESQWHTRLHARAAVAYRSHLLAARANG